MRTVLYFGCRGQGGHYLWNARGSRWDAEQVIPFAVRILDGGLLPPKAPDTEGVIYRNIINGWTVLSFWDRSVDSRGQSNSSFIIEGAVDVEEGLKLARQAFSDVLDRFKFPLVEAECQHKWGGKQLGGPPDMAESTEWVEFCELCGAENQGSGKIV